MKGTPRGTIRTVVNGIALVVTLSVAIVHPTVAQATEALLWGPCPPSPEGLPDAGQECATLSVPLDYRAPGGQRIDIAISRVRSSAPGERRGVLLTNPGGPGGQGLDVPRLFAVLMPQSVLDRYDIIGFDPRFVGHSTPLTCGLTAVQTYQAAPPFEQPGGFAETVAFVREVADACAHASGGLLPYATTANTARDMDVIRQALGEEKISFMGLSYGTYLGAVYASLFPHRTDRVLLDSAVNPSWVWRELFRDWGLSGAVRFPDFAQFAAANDETFHLGTTSEEVRQLYFELFDRLDRNPIPLSGDVLLNGPLFRALTFDGLYSDFDLPNLASLWQFLNESLPAATIETAALGLRGVNALNGDVPLDNVKAARLAILCGDAEWSDSVARYERELRRDSSFFPMFGPLGSQIWPCAFWPNRPVEPPVRIAPDGPRNILILQNLRDPATSYWGALGMRHALAERSRIVTVDQGGHGVFFTPNTCAFETATAFLVMGILPKDDPFCAAEGSAATTRGESAARARAMRALRNLMRP